MSLISSYDLIKKLGINLFIGTNKYNDTSLIKDNNYIYKTKHDMKHLGEIINFLIK